MKNNLFKLSQDTRGNWRRQNLGKVFKEDYKPQTFYLGKDYAEACLRVAQLGKVWAVVEAHWKCEDTPFPIWDENTLPIAFAVASGETPIKLTLPQRVKDQCKEASDLDMTDTALIVGVWLRKLQAMFPFLSLCLADEVTQTEAEKLLHQVATGQDERASKLQAKTNETKLNARRLRGENAEQDGPTVKDALKVYQEYILTKHKGKEFGRTQSNQISHLMENSENLPLAKLNADKLTAWIHHFQNRPNGERGKLSERYCVNLVKTIRDFARWLDRSDSFVWDMPRKFVFEKIKVVRTSDEIGQKTQVEQVKRYSVAEVAILWQYALPVERVLLVFGLNCGFAQKELSTLTTDEIFLNHTHPKYTKLTANFVKRVRRKTGVYAEWRLWDITAKAIEWTKKNRPKTDRKTLLINKQGKAFDELTKGGSPNHQLANSWNRLYKRVKKDFPTFKKLPFKYLRKTGASLIRSRAGAEVASMFLSHGAAADHEDKLLSAYTNRPFGRLFKGLRKLEKELAPIFATVPDPFPETTQETRPVISLRTINRIRELRKQRFKISGIAKECKVSVDTVRKYLKKEVSGEAQPT